MAELRKSKTIEQIYQKKSQLEHILLRPDTYVGSIESTEESMWVFDEKAQRMVQRDIRYVPGLFKIFDEILVNAADNFQRDPKGMTYIKVCINTEENWVSVENNGKTLPVEIHKEHKMYVPEMVFGNLLTSDNYDDDEQKVTGGRNGYGAKLTNIFSTKFIIECADGKKKKHYVQTWEGNMGTKGKPVIEPYQGKDYTKVVFYPDLSRFGMKSFDKGIVSLFKKRVYDAAGATSQKCSVYLDGELLPVKDFKEYTSLYFTREDQPQVYDRCGDRWEYVISMSEGQFQQVSFVNSINTMKGGTHVSHVTEQFVEAIQKKANSKNKGGMEIRPFHVRAHLWVFVNSLIVNPTFDSQTKETMTLKQSKFGSKCEVTDAAIKKVLNTGIVDTVLHWAKAKESIDMAKKMKGTGRANRILDVPKLEDANWAGGKNSEECTLILTEGDSAKALAMAGLSIVGRDRYGVFPLRGKPLNVRDANFQQTMNNAEIQGIMKIMGLDQKKEYESAKGLRYGSIMIMADQDHDGSHIKGLLINMIQHWWPSLFKLDGFLKEFRTPIIKATKADREVQFFTISDYEKWKKENQDGKGWTIKYYKGLGTSSSKEGKEYFQRIELHRSSFRRRGEKDDEAVDMAFNKKRADDRKDWINSYREGDTVDHASPFVSYEDFVNKELVCFSKYDVMRSIPSVVDGFKPTQRKILFGAFKRNLKADVKVAQLAGYIAEHSAYHHGEVSLQGTIVGMAQTFVGSNNINLLFPSGQFGTRLMGGKDAASARYIYTRLERIARLVFHPDDDPLLEFQNEEGQSIEPVWYIPIIPMVLVNGADGIGTGWSTSLPNYNPRDIVKMLRKIIKKQPVTDQLIPWYKGFKGTITRQEDGNGYDMVGVASRTSTNSLEITELPVRKWTQDYKEFLAKLVEGSGDGSRGKIDDFKEYHTENTVHFVLNGTSEQLKAFQADGLEKSLKLKTSLSTSNMVFFDHEGKIKRYSDEKEILLEFASLRLKYYQKRKDFHVDRLRREKELLDAKVKFILLVIRKELIVENRKRADLIQDLRSRGFKPRQTIEGKTGPAGMPRQELDVVAAKAADEAKDSYDYLLGMKIWALTLEKVEEMKRHMKEKTEELESLEKTPIEAMWERDLDALLEELDAIDAYETELAKDAQRLKEGKRGRPKVIRAPRRGRGGGRGRGSAAEGEDSADEEDENAEEDEEEGGAPPPKKPKAAEESAADFMARMKERQRERAKSTSGGDAQSPGKRARVGA